MPSSGTGSPTGSPAASSTWASAETASAGGWNVTVRSGSVETAGVTCRPTPATDGGVRSSTTGTSALVVVPAPWRTTRTWYVPSASGSVICTVPSGTTSATTIGVAMPGPRISISADVTPAPASYVTSRDREFSGPVTIGGASGGGTGATNVASVVAIEPSRFSAVTR